MSTPKASIQFKTWPYFDDNFDIGDAKDWMRQVSNLRKDDIAQVDNMTSIFLTGRKVGKVPSSSADVNADDRLNDFNWSASYLYVLIDNSGTPEWRRASLGSW